MGHTLKGREIRDVEDADNVTTTLCSPVERVGEDVAICLSANENNSFGYSLGIFVG